MKQTSSFFYCCNDFIVCGCSLTLPPSINTTHFVMVLSRHSIDLFVRQIWRQIALNQSAVSMTL